MENIAQHGSAIFTYEETGYRAISGHDYLNSVRDRAIIQRMPNRRLGALLGEDFLSCKVGMRGLYFDAERHNLVVPKDGENLFLRLYLQHRISVDVVRY
jgi:hypothetical protein